MTKWVLVYTNKQIVFVVVVSHSLSLGVLSNDEEMIKGGKKINQTNQLFFKNLFE